MLLICLLLTVLIHHSFALISRNDFEVLTGNLMENLEADPRLIVDGNLGGDSREFIEKQFENCLRLVLRQDGSKKKRSLREDLDENSLGTDILESISPKSTIPSRFTQDIVLFNRNNLQYSLVLESKNVNQNSTFMVLYQVQNNSFEEIARTSLQNGVKISTFNLENSTLIMTAQNTTFHDSTRPEMGLYEFSGGLLRKIQQIEMEYAVDVEIWETDDDIFMSIANFMQSQNNIYDYEVDSRIYLWKGSHFDLIQTIPTKGAKKITHFHMDGFHFLAVANSKDNRGATKIYSDIYRYNYALNKYEIYQRILTKACTDIKYFSLVENNLYIDHFLIAANTLADSLVYKFVDDYFIPFQSLHVEGLEQWLPVNGLNNEFALFAVSRFDGLKIFQYDGWDFQENTAKLPKILHQSGIKSVRFYAVNNTYNLVVANSGDPVNIFDVKFRHEEVKNFQNEMLTWCKKSQDRIDSLNDIFVQSKRADIEITPAESEKNLDEITSKLDSLNSLLDNVETEAEKSLEIKEISTRIQAQEAIFHQLIVHKIDLVKINGLELNLNNSLMENLHAVTLNPKKLNGKPFKDLLRNDVNIFFDSIKIHGELIADAIEIGGTLNGFQMDAENILLRTGNQKIPKTVQFNDIQVENFEADSLNGREIGTNSEEIKVDHIKNLTVENLQIGGYLNDIDVPTLHKYALRKRGNQKITGLYHFESLEAEDLQVLGEVSGKNLEELIDANLGSFIINQDLIFNREVRVKELKVTESLCGLPVDEFGNIDVLLANKSEVQHVTGRKSFENLTVQNPILLRGKIQSEQLEKMNPVKSINDPLIISGDIKITGNVTVEEILETLELGTKNREYSLGKVLESGLKLTDRTVEPILNFVQQINVEELFAEQINDFLTDSFVLEDSKDIQIIQGVKNFQGNLTIIGPVSVVIINGVNVEDLEKNVMTLSGDQNINAQHHIKKVITDRVNCPKIIFSTTPNQSQVKIINGDLNIDSITAKKITIKGSINSKNFTDIAMDTVVKNSSEPITGTKHFQNLTANHLEVKSGLRTSNFSKIFTGELSLYKNITIQQIKVENVFFAKKCNGLEKVNFGKENGQATFMDAQFNQLIVFGNVTISNTLNNISLKHLFDDTVKIDEDFNFADVIFESNVVARNISLKGQIENIDLDNVVLAYSEKEQIISDEIKMKNLSVNGSIGFNGLVNGMKLNDFVKFATDYMEENRNLTVEGNVYFAKGPNVAHINKLNVNFIKENAWFSDSDTTLDNPIQFEKAIFEKNLQTEKFLEDVNVTWLQDNYFSRSKNQTISAAFTFENDIFFRGNLSVPEIDLAGEVNRINLGKFLSIVLVDDYDQIFENTPFFDNCTIEEIGGDFKVNGLDLETDVMRHDKINMVTGRKTFENLNIISMKTDKNIKVQNVDLLVWFKNSVMTSGSYNITGRKIFQNISFETGFHLDGILNGLEFNEKNIMLKNLAQDVSGFKHFKTHPFDPLKFKAVKLKGTLNGINMADLMNNQAYKNRNNTFKSPLNFHNNLTTANVVFKKSFRGVNITDLMHNVTNLGILNNLLKSYQDMDVMADKMEISFKQQAFYLSHYKTIQEIPAISNSKIISTFGGKPKLSTISNGTQLIYYNMDKHTEKFILESIIPYRMISFYDHIFSYDYLYIEDSINSYFYEYSDKLEEVLMLPYTNNTLDTASYQNPITKEFCTVFLTITGESQIFCESNHKIRLAQILTTPGAFEAISMLIDSDIFLAIVHKSTKESQVNLWLLREDGFHHFQTIFTTNAQSISWTATEKHYFLALASGHVPEANFGGRIEIYRFDTSRKWMPWQNLERSAPTQVEFTMLPTKQLVLYVVSDNPTEPFVVFMYEGVAGFREKVVGSTMPKIRYVHSVVCGANHYVLAQGYGKINVIKAVFKGDIL